MLQSFVFHAEEPGPRLLVLGAVHGNETCGTVAIRRVVAELEAGSLTLARGRVTFVPVCNPRAFAAGVRFVERNLNRYLVPMAEPDCYEARLGNILCPLLADCEALLDIHSYTVGGPPFAFVGPPNPGERAYAAALGVPTLLTGWAEAYAATGRRAQKADADEATGTTEYARRFGATAVTIECGQHKDSGAPDVAYQAILGALRHWGLLAGAAEAAANPRLVTVTHVFYRDDQGTLVKGWKHLDPVVAGETLATTAKGEKLLAPGNGFVILPHATTPLGQEWFYFGVERLA